MNSKIKHISSMRRSRRMSLEGRTACGGRRSLKTVRPLYEIPTPEEQLAAMNKFCDKLLLSGRDECRRFLISTGIYDSEGRLTEHYR